MSAGMRSGVNWDSLEAAAQGAGDRLGQGRLADPRNILYQEMPLAQHCHQGEFHNIALAGR